MKDHKNDLIQILKAYYTVCFVLRNVIKGSVYLYDTFNMLKV